MDDTQEYFGFLISWHVFVVVVVASSHLAALCWSRKDTVRIKSHHANSIFAASQLFWQMCLHLPICTFTFFFISQKTCWEWFSSKRENFIVNSIFFHPSNVAISITFLPVILENPSYKQGDGNPATYRRHGEIQLYGGRKQRCQDS